MLFGALTGSGCGGEKTAHVAQAERCGARRTSVVGTGLPGDGQRSLQGIERAPESAYTQQQQQRQKQRTGIPCPIPPCPVSFEAKRRPNAPCRLTRCRISRGQLTMLGAVLGAPRRICAGDSGCGGSADQRRSCRGRLWGSSSGLRASPSTFLPLMLERNEFGLRSESAGSPTVASPGPCGRARPEGWPCCRDCRGG